MLKVSLVICVAFGTLCQQEDDTGVAEVKIALPFTLKKQLLTDWENVTQEPRRLVKLPRELTAADVMAQYMESKAKRSTPAQTARAQELMDGVRNFFDKVGTGEEVVICEGARSANISPVCPFCHRSTIGTRCALPGVAMAWVLLGELAVESAGFYARVCRLVRAALLLLGHKTFFANAAFAQASPCASCCTQTCVAAKLNVEVALPLPAFDCPCCNGHR